MSMAASLSEMIAVNSPFLHRVASKDVAERWRDHAADAVVVKRINRRLAEVPAGYDDLDVAPSWSVERKIRPFTAVGIEAMTPSRRSAVCQHVLVSVG